MASFSIISKNLPCAENTVHVVLNTSPLLHPIVRVYAGKCAANIFEKYERGLAVG